MGALCCSQCGTNKNPLSEVTRSEGADLNSRPGADDDTVTKLAAQLELTEAHVRRTQGELEKLSSVKESLERAADAAARERDQLRERLHDLELQLSSKAKEYSSQISSFEATVKDLNGKLQSANSKAQGELEKFSSEKESLERAADAAARERDQLREKLHDLGLQLSSKAKEYSSQISSLEATVQELNGKLQSANSKTQGELEKLSGEKESLERAADAAARERDQLRERLHDLELQLSSKAKEYSRQINSFEATVQDLNGKLQSANSKAQSELVKLSGEKETLERAADASARERDQLREKLHDLELQLSSKANEYSSQISSLEATVQDLNGKLQCANSKVSNCIALPPRGQKNEVIFELKKNTSEETLQNRPNVPINNSTVKDEIERTLAATNVKELVMNAANAENPDVQLMAVKHCRKLLSFENELIMNGILPILVQCLSRADNPSLQFEASWALNIIASGSSAHKNKVVDAGAVPLFVQLLSSPHEDICNQAVCALCKIIRDGAELRPEAKEMGFINSLLSLIKSEIPISFLRDVTRLIRVLCEWAPPPKMIIQEILAALNVLIVHHDTEILENTVRAIKFLDKNLCSQMVRESGIVPKLIPLLSHKEVEVQTQALQAVSNIVRGMDKQKQVVLKCDALSHFPALLKHQNENLCRDALWFLSTYKNQEQAVIDAGLLPMIIEILRTGEFQTQKVATSFVNELSIRGTKEQVATLINCGVIPPLCNLLSCEDTLVIHVVLDSLSRMLKTAGENSEQVANMIEECGGIDKIKALLSQKKESTTYDERCLKESIYEMSYEIIEQYFPEEMRKST